MAVAVEKSTSTARSSGSCTLNGRTNQLEWKAEVDASSSDFTTGQVNVIVTHKKGVGEDALVDTDTKTVDRLPDVTIFARGDVTAGNGETFKVSGTCSETDQPGDCGRDGICGQVWRKKPISIVMMVTKNGNGKWDWGMTAPCSSQGK